MLLTHRLTHITTMVAANALVPNRLQATRNRKLIRLWTHRNQRCGDDNFVFISSIGLFITTTPSVKPMFISVFRVLCYKNHIKHIVYMSRMVFIVSIYWFRGKLSRTMLYDRQKSGSQLVALLFVGLWSHGDITTCGKRSLLGGTDICGRIFHSLIAQP